MDIEGQIFKWDEDCDRPFEELKRLLSTTNVLKYLEFNKKIEVYEDAGDFAIGGILMQDDRLVAYESR